MMNYNMTMEISIEEAIKHLMRRNYGFFCDSPTFYPPLNLEHLNKRPTFFDFELYNIYNSFNMLT